MSKSRVSVIEHSIASGTGIGIATLSIRMPRVILAQFNTHRVFSRSAQSSRAIPVKKLLRDVYQNPYIPEFRENEKGMQSSVPITGIRKKLALFLWLSAKNIAVMTAYLMSKLNVTKEIANRVLEPFSYVTVVVTATEWQNFFKLRAHPDAQAEIDQIAVMVRNAIIDTPVKILSYGEWHLPFVNTYEKDIYPIEDLLKISTARCARVSYLNHDNSTPTKDEDLALYARLIERDPIHASPCEHQATPIPTDWSSLKMAGLTHLIPEGNNIQPWSANFRGWIQHRQTLGN